MNELQRITTSYIDVEDRFKLVGALEQDRVVTLWLSQRLLLRLLPMLFTWLDAATVSNQDSTPQNEASAASLSKEAEAEPPVLEEKSAATHLVKEVEIKQSTNQIFLGFKDEEAFYSLALNQFSLKQWLDIIRMLWKTAAWPVDVWPEHLFFLQSKSDPLVIH